MRDLLLVLHIGKLRVKAAAINRELTIAQQAVMEVAAHFPQTGWMESNAEEIWLAALKVMQQVVRQTGEERLAGLALANQRDTVVLWDRATGKAVSPVIGYADQRSQNICDRLKSTFRHPMVHFRSGLLLDPRFAAPKISWMLEHIPQALERAKNGELAMGTLDSWLLWNLTRGNVHAMDITNASRTLLYDIHSWQWEPQLLAAFGVPAAILPKVHQTLEPCGQTAATVAGFSLPILAMSNVPAAALYAAEEEGLPLARLHGGRFFLLQQPAGSEPPVKSKVQTTVVWKRGEKSEYAYESLIETGGTLLQWLKDGLGLVQEFDQIEREATAVRDSEGLLFVPAFSGLGAPYYDAAARGLMIGLSFKTTRQHMLRAALEGMAFQTADSVEILQQAANQKIQVLRADGNTTRSVFFMQFLADILGLPVERSAQADLPLLGMARWAGQTLGFWEPGNTPPVGWKTERRFEPALSEKERQARRRQWQNAVERSRAWQGIAENPA